jgi:phospholipase C
LTIASSDDSPAPGERIAFTGMLAQTANGVLASVVRRLELQQLERRKWVAVASGRISQGGGFKIPYRFAGAGNFSFRVAWRRDGAGPWTYSSPLRLSVEAIHKIKHVVVIMQENHSYDSYFGTFRGGDGIPGLAGHKGQVPCLPDPTRGSCVEPFHDRGDLDYGGPHAAKNATADMNCRQPGQRRGCKMNDFVRQAEGGRSCASHSPACSACAAVGHHACARVMGYHDGADIPNYWTYAHDFVLQDHMFESNRSWSLPAHLFLVSEWSAKCANPHRPSSCKNALEKPVRPDGKPEYGWTDITYLLHKHHISWAYYVFKGTEPDCYQDRDIKCRPKPQAASTTGIWNPLPAFTDVAKDHQLGNIRSLSKFFAAAKVGRLPRVSWIIPNGPVSEHYPGLVSAGETYVTGLIDAIMQSPDWKSTAIFLSWDDWGGFYDQLVPPRVDRNGYGLRVPGLVISPYAKSGYVDHQILSHDAYEKFIENDFLDGHTLNPRTDGRWDPRPDVRESNPLLGSLFKDFNFSQKPRPPVLLPVCPPTDLQPSPTC